MRSASWAAGGVILVALSFICVILPVTKITPTPAIPEQPPSSSATEWIGDNRRNDKELSTYSDDPHALLSGNQNRGGVSTTEALSGFGNNKNRNVGRNTDAGGLLSSTKDITDGNGGDFTHALGFGGGGRGASGGWDIGIKSQGGDHLSVASSLPSPRAYSSTSSQSSSSSASSLVSSSYCQRERRQHEGAWQHSFETRYRRHKVPSTGGESATLPTPPSSLSSASVSSSSTSLPPLWPVSSVATGPDFECGALIRAEMKSGAKNARMARPSWGACALLCGGDQCKAARQQCAAEPKCQGVAIPQGKGFNGLGILKGDYSWTSLSSTSTPNKATSTMLMRESVRSCLSLYSEARGGLPSDNPPSRKGQRKSAEQARAAWMHHGCSDFVRPHWEAEGYNRLAREALMASEEEERDHGNAAAPARAKSNRSVSWRLARGGVPPWLPLPEWGGLPEATSVAARPCRHCPPSQGLLHLGGGGEQSAGGHSESPPSPSSSNASSSSSSLRRRLLRGGETLRGLPAVHLIVVTDRAGSSLCHFLRTCLWAGVEVTVLGWAPLSPPRWQEWYLGSKPLVVADYLGRCQQSGTDGIAANATVIVTDSDVLLNVASAEELVAALDPLLPRILEGKVVFSAEGPCVTVNVAYRKHLCAAFLKREAQINSKSSLGLSALNSGLWVGQAWALRRLARRFLFASRHYIHAVQSPGTYSALQSKMKAAMAAADRVTLAVDGLLQLQLQKQRRTAAVAASGGQSFGDDGAGGGVDEDEDGDDLSQMVRVRQRYRHELVSGPSSSSSHSGRGGSSSPSGAAATSGEGLPFLVNDQSVYYLMLAVEEDAAHGVALDYDADLFLSMYGTPNRAVLAIDPTFRKRLVVLGAKGDPKLSVAQAEASARNMPFLTEAVSKASASPAFVHYNGGSKLSKWNVDVGRAALHKTLLSAHRERRKRQEKQQHGQQRPRQQEEEEEEEQPHRNREQPLPLESELTPDEVAELDALFPRYVKLVDNHLRRDASVTYSDICPL